MEDEIAAKADQVLFTLNDEAFERFSELLDAPAPPTEALQRLLAVCPPWYAPERA